MLKKILILLSIAVAGFVIGRHSQPEKISTKKVEVIKRDIKTVTRIIKQPDGTVIKERTVEDKTKSETKNTTEITAQTNKNRISALTSYSVYDKDIVYGISYERQLIGPVFVGIWGLTNHTYGISVGLSF